MDLTAFEELRKTFDEYQEQFFKCLAYLISEKRIQIRIIKPKNKVGIAHTKSGQFRDGDSITSFTGSANFTINGLFNNIDTIWLMIRRITPPFAINVAKPSANTLIVAELK